MTGDDPKAVLITGASSGIGRALALAYAAPGVTLYLSGRDAGRVADAADACRAKGAVAEGRAVDVTDAAAMSQWIVEADGKTPLDLVIANAGVAHSTSGAEGNDARTRKLFAVNVDGVVNTLLPAIPAMTARGRGRLVIIASIAGFRGLPYSAAYSASKAAVKVWGEGLRGDLWDTGVRVNVVCPGWVESRIADANNFPMPFLMPADKAAAKIRAGLARDKARIVFPWQMHLAVWLLAALPPAWTDPLLIRFSRGKKW